MNKTDRIVGHIYEVDPNNLEKFKFIPSNRPLNNGILNRLRRSFALLFIFVPIYVTKDFYILDGQHRFIVCREMGLPVRYIILDGAEPTVIMRILNTFRHNWGWREFLHMYCEQRHNIYIKFRAFMDMFPEFKFASAEVLLTQKHNGSRERDTQYMSKGYRTKRFFEGTIQINFDVAVETARKLLEFKPWFEWYNDYHFVVAMIAIFKDRNYDHKVMITKLQMKPDIFGYRRTVSEYKYMVSQAYNSSSNSNRDFMGDNRNFIMLG